MKEGVELGSLCGSSANKNLTIGNLVKGSIPLITWYCVCKASTESGGHLLHNFYFVDYCIVISHRVSDFINRLCSSEVLSLPMDVLTVMLRMVISADMRTLHAVTYFDILCPNVSVTMAMLDMT